MKSILNTTDILQELEVQWTRFVLNAQTHITTADGNGFKKATKRIIGSTYAQTEETSSSVLGSLNTEVKII